MAASPTTTESVESSEHTDGPPLTPSTIHALLTPKRRRHIIDVLGHIASDDGAVDIEPDDDGWFRFSELVDAVEETLGVDDPGRSVYSNLYHHHIPRLAEDGAVEQKKQAGTKFVRLGPNFTKVLNARNAVALVDGVSDDE